MSPLRATALLLQVVALVSITSSAVLFVEIVEELRLDPVNLWFPVLAGFWAVLSLTALALAFRFPGVAIVQVLVLCTAGIVVVSAVPQLAFIPDLLARDSPPTLIAAYFAVPLALAVAAFVIGRDLFMS
jgi:hypothetical protein